MSSSIECAFVNQCPGCSLHQSSWNAQKDIKLELLTGALSQIKGIKLPEITGHFPVQSHYRHRADFTYMKGIRGWFKQDHSFLHISDCALLDPRLTQAINEFDQLFKFTNKFSARFRVNSQGDKGVWLDMANIDIKLLLDEQSRLDQLRAAGFQIEMGQKGKQVVKTPTDKLSLQPGVPFPWFKTSFSNESKDLNGLISSFTQTNPDLNMKMIKILNGFLGNIHFDLSIEFGSGVGNFTGLLAKASDLVLALENDPRNLSSLKYNLEAWGLADRVKVDSHWKNLEPLAKQNSRSQEVLYFVNPSRAGVGPLFDSELLGDQVIYVSCHLESFQKDVTKLVQQGFQPKSIVLFDQFPHSKHFEILSHWSRE